ncbi:DUF3718 domain-containing protein [Arsukibacterium sp.]|uniref:DUF3718 domain-containing protein n=1 Tax=Arsukibacterium sp. TaxID=1977258 RepID=UPI001BD6A816|nr:DUF3718 domain-containing protein [Arsukibacterium sp.]
MKTKIIALAAVIAATSFVSTPVAANDQLALSICSYVAADSRNNLRKVLSDNRLRLSAVYSGVVCDGLPLVRHAIKHNANETAEFMLKQLPGSVVAASGDVEWAQSNGFGESPVINAIRDRSAS